MDKLTPITKTAPIVAGEQGPTDNIVHLGGNRHARRGAEKARLELLEQMKRTRSIWQITDVIECPTDLTGTALYEIWVRRRDTPDMLIVYSKEGAAPVIGGLLERMTRPEGGLAAIWTDSKATRESMGGGYSEEALPPEWGQPAKPLVGMTEKQKAMFGSGAVDAWRSAEEFKIGNYNVRPMPDTGLKMHDPFTGPEFRQATAQELAREADPRNLAIFPYLGDPREIDRDPVTGKLKGEAP